MTEADVAMHRYGVQLVKVGPSYALLKGSACTICSEPNQACKLGIDDKGDSQLCFPDHGFSVPLAGFLARAKWADSGGEGDLVLIPGRGKVAIMTCMSKNKIIPATDPNRESC